MTQFEADASRWQAGLAAYARTLVGSQDRAIKVIREVSAKPARDYNLRKIIKATNSLLESGAFPEAQFLAEQAFSLQVWGYAKDFQYKYSDTRRKVSATAAFFGLLLAATKPTIEPRQRFVVSEG